jgi:two-component system nitrogen regulation response regulator GlnG
MRVPVGVDVFIEEQRIEREYFFPASRLEAGVQVRLGKYVLLKLGMFEHLSSKVNPLPELIGQSAVMYRLREELQRVGDLDIPVLLRGETGVGKELIASALHRFSPQHQGPYKSVNMAAIPASMAAAELFGHARGAFTGAAGAREGYFCAADGGTLFLDEIGQAALEVQTALLRVMETSVIQPLGGSQRRVAVRLVAATDSDLPAAIEAGQFSHALLQRFGYEVHIPALRARRDDIPELFAHFLSVELKAFGQTERTSDDDQPVLRAAHVQQLMRYHWPGNVRELRNFALRYALRCGGPGPTGGRTSPNDDDLFAALALPVARAETETGPERERDPTEPSANSAAPSSPTRTQTRLKRELKRVTDQQIIEKMSACDFEIERVARELRMSRSSLHSRILDIPSLRKAKDLSGDEIEAALERHAGDLVSVAQELKVSAKGLRLRMTSLKLSYRHPGREARNAIKG